MLFNILIMAVYTVLLLVNPLCNVSGRAYLLTEEFFFTKNVLMTIAI